MDERHDPSACRRILREARESGLSRKLFDLAQDLQDGIYRAEALCGLCGHDEICLLYTSPSPRDQRGSRMPSSA